MFSAIDITQQARYQLDLSDREAISASKSIALSQELYYVTFYKFADNYNELVEKAGLQLSDRFNYGPIEIYKNLETLQDCYRFAHKFKASPASSSGCLLV
jgi:hypothetical protein